MHVFKRQKITTTIVMSDNTLKSNEQTALPRKNPKFLYIAAAVIAVVAAIILIVDGKKPSEAEEASAKLPVISGHRGANCIAPENTMASADSCIKYGIPFMETDVTISADSVFYLLHDSTLERTTGVEGSPTDYTSDFLDGLDAGAWFGDAWKGQHLLRFEDLLAKAKDNNLNVTVDYRKGDFKALVDLISKYDMLERTCFTFSEDSDCIEFRKLFPDIKTLQAYVTDINDLDRVMEAYSPNIIVNWIDKLDENFVKTCHDRGLDVLALVLGLDDKTEANRRAVELGVDVVATDRPEEFKRQFAY